MGKKGRIILITVAALVLLIVAAVLVWVFPLRSKWTKEVAEPFTSPESAERYVCEMTYSSKESGDDEPNVSEYKVISNARGDGVWRYVANAESGLYMRGDVCYEYDGDPLSGGDLTYVTDGADAPLPDYMDYFAFLFGERDVTDLGEAAKRVNKFVWGDSVTYTFSVAPEWIIENELDRYHIYDRWYYHCSDLGFKVVKNGRTGMVTRIECSYDYNVERHMAVDVFPNRPTNVYYTGPYAYDIDMIATFTYPESDSEITTDAQFELLNDLNVGHADKSLTRHTGEYLRPVGKGDPFVEYVYPDDDDDDYDDNANALIPEEDIFAVYENERLEIYRASTLEKLCTMEHYLGVSSVYANDGRLLVKLNSSPLYADGLDLPWEKNVCFIVYDLSDFSVVCRHKAEGTNPYNPGNCYLYGDKLIYADRFGELILHDVSTGETLHTGCNSRDLYLDEENGKVIYEYDLQEYRAYDIATGEITDVASLPASAVPHIGDHIFEYDYTDKAISLINERDGKVVYTFEYVSTDSDCSRKRVMRMADGRYFCSMFGCLFVIDADAVISAT